MFRAMAHLNQPWGATPTYLLVAVLLSSVLGAQRQLIDVTQVLEVGHLSPGSRVHLRLPLENGSQQLVSCQSGQAGRLLTDAAGFRSYEWTIGAATGDTLRLDYRLVLGGKTKQPTGAAADYALPPIPNQFARSGLSAIRAEEDTVATITRILRHLRRRVRVTPNPQRFDYRQSLLQDYHQRLSTTDRRHLLLSLALQDHGIPHRMVAGKWLADGTVYENQLWVEAWVQGIWLRLDLLPNELQRAVKEGASIGYLVSTYDWRDASLVAVTPGGQSTGVPYASGYSNVVDYFYYKKDVALEQRKYAEAVTFMDSILNYLPGDTDAVGEKGVIYAQAGRPEEGIRYLQYGIRNARTRRDSAAALIHFAKYYSLTGELALAYQALERSHKLVPVQLVLFYDPRLERLLESKDYHDRLQAIIYASN